MNMTLNREPPITLLQDDFNKLSNLAAVHSDSPVVKYLAHELERAEIVTGLNAAARVVRLGSRVRFHDLAKPQPNDVVLVMPNDADIGKGFISVLTPVGAALLGLAEGQKITFTLPNGADRTLAVLAVDQGQDDSMAARG
ncbi:MAG: nucleoside diphosphate kinase regulator [Rhodospirillaceae bacterium]|nr:nucleoside diphosphate kinase regulator [Rhodospirillaceae bacterium]